MFLAVSLFRLRMGCGRRRSPFSSLTFVLVSFGTLSLCLLLKTLPLSSQRRLCFLYDSGNRSSFHNIFSNSEVSISHHLINMKFHCSFQSLTVRILHCFVQLLDHAKPSQSEVEQSPLILTCTILPGSRLEAFRLLLIVHDPIVHRNLGRGHSSNS